MRYASSVIFAQDAQNRTLANMTITFDMVLAAASVDPASVHLVRHHQKGPTGKSPFVLWRTNPQLLELYQRIQHRKVFAVGNAVASFVVDPVGATLFVGLYHAISIGIVPVGTIDLISNEDVSGLNLYELERDDRLSEYQGRLVIQWGDGYRAWVQRAGRQPKPVIELRRDLSDERFPGFLKFVSQLSELASLYPEWADRLRDAKGVYLLTCPRTKEQYVGKASGSGGFYERWLQHAALSGDAIRFRSRQPSDYQVSILEVAGSAATDAEILAMEQLWIRKLQSVARGLNGSPLLRLEADAGP